MMGRAKFKPGDVVVAQHPIIGDEAVRGIIDKDGRFYTTDNRVKGISSSAFAPSNLRPLVVIDPESADDAERLVRLFWANGNDDCDDMAAMRAALREFANPTPRIEEPQGIGAVIKDGDGALLVHDAGGKWVDKYGDGWNWETLRPVEVLAEGIRP